MKSDVRIFKDSEALSMAAAELFVMAAVGPIARGRFLAALSGGSTPSGLYRLLADEPNRSRVEWTKIFIFWGDERCVPPNAEASDDYAPPLAWTNLASIWCFWAWARTATRLRSSPAHR